MSDTPTPETDAIWNNPKLTWLAIVHLARKLEQERNKAVTDIAELNDRLIERQQSFQAQLIRIENTWREKLKVAKTPICVGRPIIEILAKEGIWASDNGNAVVAADDLFQNNPYEK